MFENGSGDNLVRQITSSKENLSSSSDNINWEKPYPVTVYLKIIYVVIVEIKV